MEWSHSTKISLTRKKKFKYVNGTLLLPVATNPTYEVWGIENSFMMSWLLQSIQPEISRNYLIFFTKCDIWMVVNRTYSKVGFTSQIFQIKRQIQKTKQRALSVTKYFNILKGLLIELDLYIALEMKSPTNERRVKEMLEQESLPISLGLNLEYDLVFYHVLKNKPFPDLDEIFMIIRNEESRRELMGKKMRILA